MTQSRSWGALLVIMGLLAACSLPATSRTGTVHEVIISDTLHPRDLEVRPGDEVRWTNRGSAPVWMYFENDLPNELSCERGFSYYYGTEEFAKIEPGQSVSLCFGRQETVGYSVQRQPTVHGGARLADLNIPDATFGAIIVTGPPRTP
jgi:hypothetical protein